MLRTGIEEIEKSSTAIKLSKENGGVCLRFRGFDPLKTCFKIAFFIATFAKNSTAITAHPHGSEGNKKQHKGNDNGGFRRRRMVVSEERRW